MKIKNKKRILLQGMAILIGCIITFPLLYAISASFMKGTEILSKSPHVLPQSLNLSNYSYVLKNTLILRFIANSLFISIVTSTLRMFVAALAAYGYSYFRFRGRKFFFYLTIGTMLIPGEATLLTNYETIAKLQLIDTYTGIIIMFIGSAASIFIMRQYFLTVSKSLKEAADMDGCSDMGFFWNILIPISKPILVTIFITAFVDSWNVYLWPMLITNTNEMRTVQVGIAQLNSSEGSAYGVIMAAVIIALIPSIALFILFQKEIVHGMVTGAIKE